MDWVRRPHLLPDRAACMPAHSPARMSAPRVLVVLWAKPACTGTSAGLLLMRQLAAGIPIGKLDLYVAAAGFHPRCPPTSAASAVCRPCSDCAAGDLKHWQVRRPALACPRAPSRRSLPHAVPSAGGMATLLSARPASAAAARPMDKDTTGCSVLAVPTSVRRQTAPPPGLWSWSHRPAPRAGYVRRRILPCVVDVGTDNKQLRADAVYMGLDQPRLQGQEYLKVHALALNPTSLNPQARMDRRPCAGSWRCLRGRHRAEEHGCAGTGWAGPFPPPCRQGRGCASTVSTVLPRQVWADARCCVQVLDEFVHAGQSCPPARPPACLPCMSSAGASDLRPSRHRGLVVSAKGRKSRSRAAHLA